jgi:hypothetical protein
MGAAADDLKRTARDLASDEAGKLQTVVESATEAVADEAKRRELADDPSNIGGARHETVGDRMAVSARDKQTGGEIRR